VLAHAFFQPFPAFSSEGARTSGHMLLDGCALQTLEVLEGSLGGREGSLLEVLDWVAMPASRASCASGSALRCTGAIGPQPLRALHRGMPRCARGPVCIVLRALQCTAAPGWPGSWPGGWPDPAGTPG
jgi:hypothetical protein